MTFVTFPFDARKVANSIEKELKAAGTPKRAEGSKRYLKSDLDFLGTTVPDLRKTIRSTLREYSDIEKDALVALVAELWERQVFEARLAGVVLLESRTDLLGIEHLDVIEDLIRRSQTWALVDPLAVNVVGTLLDGEQRISTVLARWAEDPYMWIRRASLISYIKPLRSGAAFDGFANNAELLLDEKEFFIRKAIGWVLRDASKKRPVEVREWLEPRAHRASGVTIREAVKYLDPDAREAVLKARQRSTR